MLRLLRNKLRSLRWKLFLARNHISTDFQLGAWSMQPDDYYIIDDILAKLPPHHLTIVELGSGASTVLMASILRRRKRKFSIVSIEGESSWLDETRKILSHYHIQDKVELHHAPYCAYESYHWFDSQIIKHAMRERIADLIIVDAPPGSLCELSRAPALTFLDSFISSSTHVLLHDAYRSDEKKIMHQWRKSFSSITLHRTEKGIYDFTGFHRNTSVRAILSPPDT